MINLNTTLEVLQVVLGAAKTTSDCQVFVSYEAPQGNNNRTTTNGTTAVNIATPSSVIPLISVKTVTVYNADTVAHNVTLQVYDGTSTYILGTLLVPVGKSLLYEGGVFTVIGSSSAAGRIVTLASQGTLLNTYTTAKTILPAAAVPTLPANFWQVGKQMKIRGVAGLSNIVTTPGTLTLQVMVGSVIAYTSGALQLNATAHTLLPVTFEIYMTCRAIGSGTTAKFQGNGWVQGIQPTLTAGQTDAANTGGIFSIPVTAPALGTGFDSTAAQSIDLWAGFSISNSGNGIRIEQYTVDII